MAQPLKTLDTFAEGLSFIPSTCMAAQLPNYSNSRGFGAPSKDTGFTCRQDTDTHRIKNKISIGHFKLY